MINIPESKLTKSQTKTLEKLLPNNEKITVKLRYDDQCNNGHNTFAMTHELRDLSRRGEAGMISCGCGHELIAEHFPELAKYIKWHLTSSDGPMHYVSNAMYHVSKRDCWGKLKGEPRQWETKIFFNDVPIPYELKSEKFIKWLKEQDVKSLEVREIAYEKKKGETYDFTPKYTFVGFGKTWYDCPFDDKQKAQQFLQAMQTCKVEYKTEATSWGEGKEPDLEGARHCAVWPEANLEDFTKENLEARLPSLMEEFKRDMEELGFEY